MTELLIGGGIGTMLGVLGLGFILWRERGKRADAESDLAHATARITELEKIEERAKMLAMIVDAKEVRIHELEVTLAAIDSGAVLDSVFKPRPKPPTNP